jgi:ATP adenylyltransferase
MDTVAVSLYFEGQETRGGMRLLHEDRGGGRRRARALSWRHSFITLNRYPYNNGHVMVVPYLHTPSLESLDDETSLELMTLVRRTLHILRDSYHPDGFNLGVNEGSIAGAGIAGHVHFHIVPRWSGDVNYMSAVGEVRVIPEMLDDTYQRLKPYYEALPHL